ncbi:tetratricopeptide repeat protein [Actinoplanes sp. LDG1-06]|uniref:Tetratricopeptide repeat protein n=1 Tax=Paractinoplanes ovalisporus TaxID=2810368 RepID=A0ABS2ALK8_9ACTN|nr:tetratricopeptide repeat protein [Actinoplanes ovalisporus]MBM2620747.1 tetratricopeptide repeat protein [Actinoplanes ovalisporus]
MGRPDGPETDAVRAFATLPDPAQAGSLDDVAERLRRLKVWAGDPSYDTIKDRVNAAWTAAGRPARELTRRSTVADCFRAGRRRLNTDLVVAIVEALHPDRGYVTQWQQALRAVGAEIDAVSQVRVQDSLPPEVPGFTGRRGELQRLRLAQQRGGAVVISAIAGMAGVGKTQLAIHAGHELGRRRPFDRVLFVNLRGFHADRAQPPADPAAVLDGFLRVLGVSGHRIPHTLDARVTAYRGRLAGTRTLVVLDNAATTTQVRPLLPDTPGCLALITSRRTLTGLDTATALTVDVFTPDEAAAFLRRAVADLHTAPEPEALARIADRCGHLPLALSLVAGHIRSFPHWTLADHADRLDERHRDRRLDSGVELALELSYQDLPADRQRLLRLAALHPGQDFDAYAAAALVDTDAPTAAARLDHLAHDHLLQPTTPGRYAFHDLVRAYATDRAHDQDPPAARRAALTRLFDYYLATAGAAMNTLHPGEAQQRPPVRAITTPVPDLTGSESAIAWLDTERPVLIAVTAHGSPEHAVALARTLSRHLKGGHHNDALTVHGHALRAARELGDLDGQAHALNGLGVAHRRLGSPKRATDDLETSLELFRRTGDTAGEAATLYELATVMQWTGRYPEAIDYKQQALALYRQAGDRIGEANMLSGIGLTLERLSRFTEAIDHCEQALALDRQIGNRHGEAQALNILGDIETRAGRHESAAGHLEQALALFRQLGNHNNEAGALDSLGILNTVLGRPERAIDYFEAALAVFRELGNKGGEVGTLNGLGEAAFAAGRLTDALAYHAEALTTAVDVDMPDDQAIAHAGLGHTHRALGDHARARDHYQQALTLYTAVGMPEAEEIRALLDQNPG